MVSRRGWTIANELLNTGREMAVGNTFGATALSSYGGFWITFGIVLTPGGFGIVEGLGGPEAPAFLDSFGLLLMVRFVGCSYTKQYPLIFIA